jgi:hypothetical protein
MALLNRDQILESDDLAFEDVPCPEWGGEVRVRNLTGTERDAWETGMTSGKAGDRNLNMVNLRARLIAASAIDENGRKLFHGADDVRALGKKSAAPIDRLFDACQRLSGLSDGDVEKMTEVFTPTPGDGDSSDSPATSAAPSVNSWHESTLAS